MRIGLVGLQIILLVLWYSVAPAMPAWLVFSPLAIMVAALVAMIVGVVLAVVRA